MGVFLIGRSVIGRKYEGGLWVVSDVLFWCDYPDVYFS